MGIGHAASDTPYRLGELECSSKKRVHGEILFPPFNVLSSVEAIAAGASGWQAMPNLPTGLHGFGAIAVGNTFTTVGGSTVAAEQINPGIVYTLRR